MGLGCAIFVLLAWTAWDRLEPAGLYDSHFYLDMARNGLKGNHGLEAPYAYRFPVPLAAGWLARLTGVGVERAFGWLTGFSAWLFLVAVYAGVRAAGGHRGLAAFSSGAFGFSVVMLRFHLYWHALVDIEALVLNFLAVALLWTGRFRACWLVCCLGVHFKEFLVLPGLLACLGVLLDPRRSWRLNLLCGGGGLIFLAISAGLPRLLIPVVRHQHYFTPKTPLEAVLMALDFLRDPNLAARGLYSVLLVAFPLALLLTPTRLRGLVEDLQPLQIPLVLHIVLVWVLAMLGGVGIPRFFSYLAPWLVLLLARARPGPGAGELLMALVAVFVYNRPWQPMPNPALDVYSFCNFYGGDTLSSAPVMLARGLEMVAWIVLLRVCFRRVSPTGKDCPEPASP